MPRALVVLVGLVVGSQLLEAQGSPAAFGTLRGVAFDSLAGGPLGGALVWAQGLTRTSQTDSGGRFLLDSLPPGRHVLVLVHPDFDGLGIPQLTTTVAVTPGATDSVSIAMPSLPTIWWRLCPGSALGADSGIAFGGVRDADSDSMLAGATVEAAWQTLTADSSRQVNVGDRGLGTRTDSRGAYVLCGLATGQTVFARARAGTLTTGLVEVVLAPRPLTRMDLVLARAIPDSTLGARHAVLTGTVRSRQSGRPVPNAFVEIEGADLTTTDSSGSFRLADLPAGSQWLRVRAIGFSPLQRVVHLRGRGPTDLLLELQAITVLDTITVVGAPRLSRELEEFEERRRTGWGYAFREHEVARYGTLRTLFQNVPGTHISSQSVRDFSVQFSARNIQAGWCVANLFIDGTETTFDELMSYDPDDLAAIEVYPRATTAPMRYQNLRNGCGVILVWTKRVK